MLAQERMQVAVLKVVGFTVLPALGEVHRTRPQDMRDTIYRIRKPLDIVCLVAAGALLMLGPAIVDILYDDRYLAAGWMLSLLSLTLSVAPESAGASTLPLMWPST